MRNTASCQNLQNCCLAFATEPADAAEDDGSYALGVVGIGAYALEFDRIFPGHDAEIVLEVGEEHVDHNREPSEYAAAAFGGGAAAAAYADVACVDDAYVAAECAAAAEDADDEIVVVVGSDDAFAAAAAAFDIERAACDSVEFDVENAADVLVLPVEVLLSTKHRLVRLLSRNQQPTNLILVF